MLPYKKIVITGGAGFVGSHLAISLKRDNPHIKVISLDNLYRRGSELSLRRLRDAEVEFVHGDIRCKEDIAAIFNFDLLIECSAEPSVQAGYQNDPSYLVQTNLFGTMNCLEAARRAKADVIFLSTSRVYPIEPLRNLPLKEEGKRFVLDAIQNSIGVSLHGISTQFPLEGIRSLYGATKLASELLLQEYAHMYDLNIVINRSGVIAGPWQMGKVDQGFVSLWISRYIFNQELKYTGFGGNGYQVRDVLHIEDLYELLVLQLNNISKHKGKIYNIGGGMKNSISLAELSSWCIQRTGNNIPIINDPTTHPADIPFYVSDNEVVTKNTGWAPKRSLDHTLEDIFHWILANQIMLKPIFS
ncbi:MAG: NAD-dependent epimerase/dehydratase family protein [Chlamydiota bacterium]